LVAKILLFNDNFYMLFISALPGTISMESGVNKILLIVGSIVG
jgi:hypothetical protein